MKRMADTPPQPSTLRHASALIANGDHRTAHGLCLAALQKGEAPAQALFLLALIAADHRNPAKALELAERALVFEDDHPGARAQRARALLARGASAAATIPALPLRYTLRSMQDATLSVYDELR